MKISLVQPLHYHCPTCDHCAESHHLIDGLPGFTLLFGRTEPKGIIVSCDICGGICAAQHNPETRISTLANMAAQSWHKDLWMGL